MSKKRHTQQNSKQRNGQYFTTNADHILSGFEFLVEGKVVVDPFAGGCDLLSWAIRHGATEVQAFDIDPKLENVIKNDSISNPICLKSKFLLTNPPYLSKNKAKPEDKGVFEKWGQSDLYKCHMASLVESDCQEGILILPGNFFCESRPGIRNLFFEHFSILYAKYWDTPVFEDTTICICAFYFVRGGNKTQTFDMEFDSDRFTMVLEEKYDYLFGSEFFEYIKNQKYKISKTDVGMPAPNSKIIISLLDNGALRSGFHFNTGEDIYCKPTSFTTFQVTLDMELTVEQQEQVIVIANDRLSFYREKYKSFFLANYIGPKQKILSRSFTAGLLSKAIEQVVG